MNAQLLASFSTAILMACVIWASVKSRKDCPIDSRIIGVSWPMFCSYARNASAGPVGLATLSQPLVALSAQVSLTLPPPRVAATVFSISRSSLSFPVRRKMPRSQIAPNTESNAGPIVLISVRSVRRSLTVTDFGNVVERSSHHSVRQAKVIWSTSTSGSTRASRTALGTLVTP